MRAVWFERHCDFEGFLGKAVVWCIPDALSSRIAQTDSVSLSTNRLPSAWRVSLSWQQTLVVCVKVVHRTALLCVPDEAC